MTKYKCITIGPIITSLTSARKTREIWGASFVFSWVMWNIVKRIKEKGKYQNIVIPYKKDFIENLGEVGLYPDHLVYRCNEEDDDDLKIEDIIKEVKKELKKYLGEERTKELVENYFQFQYFSIELNEEKLKQEGKNFLQVIDDIFYSLELQGSIRQETKYSFSNFLKDITSSELFKEHFGVENFKNAKKKKCPALIEIATHTIRGEECCGDDNTENFIQHIKDSVKDRFKSYHKYVAVVQCDGDKMGQFNRGYIKSKNLQREPEEAIRNVSDCLFRWGEEASKKVTAFGGLPVYAGGDDLLFFAPVVGCGEEKEEKLLTVLLEEINCLFQKKMLELTEEDPKVILPTLSFGVALSYYKYPLGEAQQRALELMYEMKSRYGGNGMNLSLLKHSGSGFSLPLHFRTLAHNESYSWETVFHNLMKLDANQMNEVIISSVAYALQRDRKVFDQIAGKKERIRQFFLHNMDGFPKEEEITLDGKYKSKEANEPGIHFLLEVEKLVKLSFIGRPIENEKGRETDRMRPVFDMLRIVKFLKGLDEKH